MNLSFSRQYTITAWELRAGELQIEPYFKYISLSGVWRMYWYLRRLRIETHQRIRWLQQQSTGEKKSVKIKAAAVIKLRKILWGTGHGSLPCPSFLICREQTHTSMHSKRQIQTDVNQGREEMHRQGRSRQETVSSVQSLSLVWLFWPHGL